MKLTLVKETLITGILVVVLGIMIYGLLVTRQTNTAVEEMRTYAYTTQTNINKNLNTMNEGVGAALKNLKNAIASWHGVSFDIRKNFTSNQDRISDMQERTLKTFDTLNQGLAQTIASAGPVIANVNGLVTDLRFAIPVLTQDIHEVLQEIRGSIALIVNDKLVGLLDITAKNIDEIGQEVKKLFPTAKITIEQVNQLVGNVDQIAFFLAKIVEDGSEVSEYCKNKLLHPSRWERVKAVLNLVLYTGGNIIAPWLITQKVKVIN